MGQNTYRDDSDTSQPDSYWRRRVIALTAGLGLLGLLAWALSGGGGKPASPLPRMSPASGVLPAAAYGSPTVPGLPSSSATPSAGKSAKSAAGQSMAGQSIAGKSAAGQSARPKATGTAQAKNPSDGRAAGAAATGSATGGATGGAAGAAATRGGSCSPSSVVLSLFSTKAEYYGGQYPKFDVFAVSTGSGACAFQAGPAKLHVVVMSAGRIIWDSADCARGKSSRITELSRGVPVQEVITWNRSINLPGCVTLASAARPGTYQAQTRGAATASPVRTFKLAGLTPVA
jgi:hypothetical protein